MKFQEDLTIEKKYLNLMHMAIYDEKYDKHGIITEISLYPSLTAERPLLQFNARFDNINDNETILIEDFCNGKLKFVFFTGGMWESGLLKQVQEEELTNIKDVFGTEYNDDMVMWIDEEDRKTKLEEQKHRQKQYIGSELVNLDSFSEEVVYDSYSMLHAFNLYTHGIIDEKQMLYAMVNALAAEKRVERDMRLNTTNESFSAEIRKHLEENKDFWKELFKVGRDGEINGEKYE